MTKFAFTVLVTLGVFALTPATVWAQSSIAGIVRDTSGAVLPGVSVEAASPVLIQKIRTGVTDGQGRYTIVDLPPGAYSVTFTLNGFRTVRQENIQLAASFNATVNADMGVGALEETVSVTGEAPLVDLRNTGQQQTISRELLSNVPTGATVQSYAVLMPSVSQAATSFASGPNSFRWADLTFRGTRESSTAVDGFDTSHRLSGDGSQYVVNDAMIQEIVVSGASGAEIQGGGVIINAIPRSGGNRFSGSFSTFWANEDLVANNLTDELRRLGVTTQSVRKAWDVNPALGGPIKRDKLWFYVSYRNLGNATDTGIRRDVDPLDWVYTPDLTRSTDTEQLRTRNYSARLTWQINQKNTFTVHGDHNPNDWDNRGGTTAGQRTNPLIAPEATVSGRYNPQYVAGFGWKSPVNNRLYLDGGLTVTKNAQWFSRNERDAQTGEPVSPNLGLPGAIDLDTNTIFRGSHFIGNFNRTAGTRPRATASFVTGTHTAKFGFQGVIGKDQAERYRIADYIVRLRSGTPVSLELWGPENRTSRLKSVGLFAQDQWTLKRATLNIGMRYDYVTTSADPQTLPANTMLPERSFDGIDKIIHLHDISPRLGAAYDLFGNNRTAIKFALNRFLSPQDFTGGRHPTALAPPNTTRDWTDRNNNFIPDCDFRNLEVNNECGRAANLNFGSITLNPTLFDPRVDGGFGHREYTWESSGGVQHHVMQGLGVELSYYRRSTGNQRVTENILVQPSDFAPFCVMTPSDPRLPGSGNQRICGFYDLDPLKLGQVQNFTTLASDFGGQARIYTGIEFNLNARLPGGIQLTGGTITQRVATDDCNLTVDNPSKVFCKQTPPFLTTLKMMGTYPLPVWGVQLSGALQMLPGPALNASRSYGRSEILDLPRQLSTATATLTIVEPNSSYNSHVNKADVRVSKVFRVAGQRYTGSLDVLNVFNSAGILVVNTTVGSAWQNPQQVLGGRLFRISARVDF
jgi:hypothetical protein